MFWNIEKMVLKKTKSATTVLTANLIIEQWALQHQPIERSDVAARQTILKDRLLEVEKINKGMAFAVMKILAKVDRRIIDSSLCNREHKEEFEARLTCPQKTSA